MLDVPDRQFDASTTFDVIIVGAGPAGCVLASRLSEDPDKQTLLIEAGPDAVPGTEHPDALDPFPVSAANPAFHWPGLVAETGADPGNGAARVTRPYLQGYGVGGASNINGMGADRGNPGDYDEWRDLGAQGWAWADVLPYFNKLERDLDFPSRASSSLHGATGPMPVRRLARSQWTPFAAAIGNAAQRRGMPFIEDYNVDFREGFGAAPINCLPKRRVSASMAYLTREVRCRANLTILADARVDRVTIEGTRANGALVHRKGVTTLVRGRQIVLACGAIQSPAVLMRSGIGPQERLKRHGIEVVADLPAVGANLQNHPCISVATHLRPGARQPSDNPGFLQNWLRFSSNHPGCDRNDMHLIPFNRCSWHELGRHIGAVVVAVFKSYSMGRVELSSPDPATAPKVHFNLLADHRDHERLVSGLRFVLELLTDPGMESMRHEIFLPHSRTVARLSRRNAGNAFGAHAIAWVLDRAPARSRLLAHLRIDPEQLMLNEETLRDFVRMHAQPEYHVCGTCRMGRADDAGAVVDSTARVRGIEALRVADASIFPTIPRANTHFTVLMAAEKIADAIKSDWRADRWLEPAPHRQASVKASA